MLTILEPVYDGQFVTIALFALTGFGNPVLRAMLSIGFKPALLVTRRERGAHPYYTEIDLAREASRAGVPIAYDDTSEAAVAKLKPDLILVATYHRILSDQLLRTAAMALNVHPSLLPAYRGPSPFYWALRNGEMTTGVTVHLLSSEVDQGAILLQRVLAIAPEETLGSLRKKLADLSGVAVLEFLTQIADGIELRPIPQPTEGASYFPRLNDADRRLDLQMSPDEIVRCIRAVSPWPGAVLHDMNIVGIERIERGSTPAAPSGGEILNRWSSGCALRIADMTITLRIRQTPGDGRVD